MADTENAYYKGLLSQYLDGTISQEDRFILEKRALDDPFLFEAMEGFRIDIKSNNAIIENLNKRLDERSIEKKTRTIPLFNYGIAASLVLLLGAGLWFFSTTTNEMPDAVVMNTHQTSESREHPNNYSQEKEADLEDVTQVEVQESESLRVPSKNQYDSPKAVISQSDNEETARKVKLDIKKSKIPLADDVVSEPIIKSEAKKYSAGVAIVEDSRSGSPSETSESEVEEIIIKEESIVLDKDAGMRDEILTESIVVTQDYDQTKARYKRDASINKAQSRISQELQLDRNEYVVSMDENIIVAPPDGISTFRAKFYGEKNAAILANKSDQEVIIQFLLTSEGKPTNLRSITTDKPDCSDKVIEAIKTGGNWISSPPNSPVVVRLKMPCL